jgi:S-DNA-T family DNA segregation ATPase FtsK/SpoIIIE
MHSPSMLDPSAFLGLERDLLSDNRRRIRGLGERWESLLWTHSVGGRELQQKIETCTRTFQEVMQDLQLWQQQALEQAITGWDELLDLQLASTEKSTFESLTRQKNEVAREKGAYKASRGSEINAFEHTQQQLRKRIESSKVLLVKTRDTALAKLEYESRWLEQRMQQVREWIGLKTADPVLTQWQSNTSSSRVQEIINIPTLDGVTREFDQTKQRINRDIEALQQHPSLRLVNMKLLVALGGMSGFAFGWIPYFFGATPLICGVAAIAGAGMVPAIVSLASTPILTRILKRSFPPVVDLEKEGRTLLQQGRKLIERNHSSSISKLDEEMHAEMRSIEDSHRQKLEIINSTHQENKKGIAEKALQARTHFASKRKAEMDAIDQRESKSLFAQKKQQTELRDLSARQHAAELAKMRRDFEASLERTTERWRRGVMSFAHRINAQSQSLATAFPAWDSASMNEGLWPRSEQALAWPIGDIGVKERFLSTSVEVLPDQYGISEHRIPILFDLLHHGSLVIDTDMATRTEGQGLVRHLLLRAMTALPAGAMQVTVIDPEGLGKEFSWMMHLADIDPQLVNHRAWTQPVHIAHQLELHARHVEDIIQQSLRNHFQNLAHYNRQAGPMAIPYRLIVWSGFPFGLDEHSWQSLCSLLASGARCGVGLILRIAENCKWPSFADPGKLREHGLVIEMRGEPKSVALCNSGFDDSSLRLCVFPIDAQVQSIMEHQLTASRSIGKRIVPFSSIAPQEPLGEGNPSADGLEIPIGISESGRVQTLSLGSGTAQHVLIAGKTGSGKSSLLHTLITSAALRYAPDQLRMVLLDFKKGVEFQVYAQAQLPHADILGIESRREFGLSALEYLDRILTARGEAFREWGVQDLPSLKRRHPDVVLPRILIIIDEFQELFVEDDKLSQQASLLVDRLVRQGRSFGMHLVLASQTLGGSYSLPRTTLAQMAVRIALQCDSSDAMLILSDDNTAAERLRHSGQGIYNASGGRIEGNHNFQVSYLEKQEQMRWLEALPTAPCIPIPTINPLGKRIVFEGHKPSRWDAPSVQGIFRDRPSSLRSQTPWVLGESVSIDPAVIRVFPPLAGRNAMIVGSDSAVVAGLLASWIRTVQIADPENRQQVRFVIVDGSAAEDTNMAKAIAWAGSQSQLVDLYVARSVELAIQEFLNEFNNRSTTPDQPHAPWILIIANLSRFRELRKSEDFSFSSQEGEMAPDVVLAKLLADGPSLGIHVCIWVDTATTLGRWLSRNALRDIEIRVLMQMSAADSNQLIDSSLANRLDRNVLLVHDDTDGKSYKFRPYDLDSVLRESKKG